MKPEVYKHNVSNPFFISLKFKITKWDSARTRSSDTSAAYIIFLRPGQFYHIMCFFPLLGRLGGSNPAVHSLTLT